MSRWRPQNRGSKRSPSTTIQAKLNAIPLARPRVICEQMISTDTMSIVSDPEIRSGEPRIDGTRITVLDVKRRVIDEDEDPHVVAGEYEVSMAALFTALAYYNEHREDFAKHEREFATARADGERRTRERLASEVDRSERAD